MSLEGKKLTIDSSDTFLQVACDTQADDKEHEQANDTGHDMEFEPEHGAGGQRQDGCRAGDQDVEGVRVRGLVGQVRVLQGGGGRAQTSGSCYDARSTCSDPCAVIMAATFPQ